MNQTELQNRTKHFAIRIVNLVKTLQTNPISKILSNQILRSGTSVAANYRAACRCRSAKDFIAKLAIVIEEADETMFWLELLQESNIIKPELLENLHNEANQITAIMVASRNSAIKNLRS